MASTPQLPLEVPSDLTQMAGPNKWCNWAIKTKLLIGSFPRDQMLQDVVNCGATCFICLITHKELERTGGPYIEKVRKLYAEVQKPKAEIEFIHLPIFDKQTADDCEIDKLSNIVIQRILDGKIVYLHCMGGHGRSGVIVSIVLARLYGLNALNALKMCEKCHEQRGMCLEAPGTFKSPETHEQRDQVFRLVDKKKKK